MSSTTTTAQGASSTPAPPPLVSRPTLPPPYDAPNASVDLTALTISPPTAPPTPKYVLAEITIAQSRSTPLPIHTGFAPLLAAPLVSSFAAQLQAVYKAEKLDAWNRNRPASLRKGIEITELEVYVKWDKPEYKIRLKDAPGDERRGVNQELKKIWAMMEQRNWRDWLIVRGRLVEVELVPVETGTQ